MLRHSCSKDVSDEEWICSTPYLISIHQHAPKREHDYVKSLTRCADCCVWEHPGGCCLMLYHLGKRFARKAGAGWMRAALRQWPRSALHHSRGERVPEPARRSGDGWAHAVVELRKLPMRRPLSGRLRSCLISALGFTAQYVASSRAKITSRKILCHS